MDIKKKRLILAVFISFIMIGSIAGFITLPAKENNLDKKVYKGLEFNKINNKWAYLLNNNPILLSFDPELLQEQNIIKKEELNSAQKIYFSTNQNETENILIYQELNVLSQVLVPKSVNSCYEESEKCTKLPIRTCKDAKDLNKVIIIKKENNKSISYNNNCLEIRGSEIEIIEFIDQLILSVLTD